MFPWIRPGSDHDLFMFRNLIHKVSRLAHNIVLFLLQFVRSAFSF